MTDVTMPQLGETVTEGTITRWFKQVGDKVEEDEALFEVSTDKVDSEVPSSVSGYVAEILVKEGETVDVGAKLAVISDQPAGSGDAGGANGQGGVDIGAPTAADKGEPGSPDAAAAAEEADAEEADAAAEPASTSGATEPDGAATAGASDGDRGSTPAGSRAAGDGAPAEDGAGVDTPGGSRPAGDGRTARPRSTAPAARSSAAPAARSTAAAARAAAAPAAEPASDRADGSDSGGQATGPRRVLSPVVRRLIAENNLDPDDIAGTGYQNRITRDDVLAHLDRGAAGASPRPTANAPSQAGTAAAPTAARSAAGARAEADEILPFSNIRRRTAEHMVRSLDTSAHVLTVIEVDFDNVDRVRQAAKGRWKEEEGFSLTYLPFVSRAVIDAVRDFPHVNASVDGESLVVHRAVHLGFAVDLNFEGLIVPVIHDADAKRMRGLARELADLAARARGKKLNADEIQGATFTITNPGGYGTLLTFPVINQPNVAIVSTDGVRKRPVVVELPDGSDAIAIHPVGNLALSFDHRAFDGAYASAFIARVRDILETRDWSLEL